MAMRNDQDESPLGAELPSKVMPGWLTKSYFLNPWRPFALVVVISCLFFANEFRSNIPYIGLPLLLAMAASLLGMLGAALVQLVKGRKLWGAINLIALLLVGLLISRALAILIFSAMFNDEPDNFGKDIVIPSDLKVSEPVEHFDEPGGPANDELTSSIVAAFAPPGATDPTPRISTDLKVLDEFATANRGILIRHLSASPRWFVTEEAGKPYAYRRLVIAEKWENSLNGFYSSFAVAPSINSRFQTRIVIGFDGPVFEAPFRKVLTNAPIGSGEVPMKVVDDLDAHQGKESYFLLKSARASVEIFEQSSLDARPITQLALAEIRRELESALTLPPATVSPHLPASTSNEPAIQLARGMQGGIYHVRAFVNPGEPGRAYLKVFEATRNTPLSAARIEPRSMARIGWSVDPRDKFRYLSEITVYEGDWGTFYPGRFELWFIPDSGKPDRKLLDRIFRIEGWMR